VDLFAMGLCLSLTFLLAIGVKDSSKINSLLSTCNVAVVLFFIIAGSLKGKRVFSSIITSQIID